MSEGGSDQAPISVGEFKPEGFLNAFDIVGGHGSLLGILRPLFYRIADFAQQARCPVFL